MKRLGWVERGLRGAESPGDSQDEQEMMGRRQGEGRAFLFHSESCARVLTPAVWMPGAGCRILLFLKRTV